jgi:hypothetical protein
MGKITVSEGALTESEENKNQASGIQNESTVVEAFNLRAP